MCKEDLEAVWRVTGNSTSQAFTLSGGALLTLNMSQSKHASFMFATTRGNLDWIPRVLSTHYRYLVYWSYFSFIRDTMLYDRWAEKQTTTLYTPYKNERFWLIAASFLLTSSLSTWSQMADIAKVIAFVKVLQDIRLCLRGSNELSPGHFSTNQYQ